MGRATIVSTLGSGRYTVSIDSGEATRTDKVARLTAAIDEQAARIVVAQAAYDAAQASAATSQSALNAATAGYVAASGGDSSALESASRALKQAIAAHATAQGLAASKKRELDGLRLARVRAVKERGALLAMTLTETRQVWCADRTDSASGTVATIEIPGESGLVLIKPGAPAWTPAAGFLFNRAMQSPEQAFFNAAILPGWQKFKPTYRSGTITAIDREANTADVALGVATSSAQGLGVNQASNLAGVPVVYMTCNAGAFSLGDRVVVQFTGQNWAAPVVIGFLDTPKYCTGLPQPSMELVVTDAYTYTVEGPPLRAYKHWEMTFTALLGDSTWVSDPPTISTPPESLEIPLFGGEWQWYEYDDWGNLRVMDAFLATIPSRTFYVSGTIGGITYGGTFVFVTWVASRPLFSAQSWGVV